jgi:hypothetical protein
MQPHCSSKHECKSKSVFIISSNRGALLNSGENYVSSPFIPPFLAEAFPRWSFYLIITIATLGLGFYTFAQTLPSLSINDVTVTEGEGGGTTNAVFSVTLSAASTQTVTVNYATRNNSATAPADYTATSGTLTFAPGERSKTFTVPGSGGLCGGRDGEFLRRII